MSDRRGLPGIKPPSRRSEHLATVAGALCTPASNPFEAETAALDGRDSARQ
jgi:hypothetical protein